MSSKYLNSFARIRCKLALMFGYWLNVHQIREELESRGCIIRTGGEVHSVLSDDEGESLNSMFCSSICFGYGQDLFGKPVTCTAKVYR